MASPLRDTSDIEHTTFYLHLHPLTHKKTYKQDSKQKTLNLQPLRTFRSLTQPKQVSVIPDRSILLLILSFLILSLTIYTSITFNLDFFCGIQTPRLCPIQHSCTTILLFIILFTFIPRDLTLHILFNMHATFAPHSLYSTHLPQLLHSCLQIYE